MSIVWIARCIGPFVWFSDIEPAYEPAYVCEGLAKAAREDVVILGGLCGSILIARDLLFGLLGV